MTFLSSTFRLFLLGMLLAYYLCPGKYRHLVLLAGSYVYYVSFGLPLILFLWVSTLITYISARCIQRIYQSEKRGKDERPLDVHFACLGNKKAARAVLLAGLLSNFGILAFLKYAGFFSSLLNLKSLHFLLPLGISFYTFQSSGYLLDVYWQRIEAEKNLARYSLFVSFFPQLMQGPIGRYEPLSLQLFTPHDFSWLPLIRGAQRMVWGVFKKMVIADWAGVFADAIFDTPDQYPGLALLGVLMYTIQLYGDFSGAIDIVIGVGELFGITLDENFRQPFFARSIADFWHRWHITLGSWMKDYVFYPITMSHWMHRLNKGFKQRFGRKRGRAVGLAIGNIIVFLAVGLWHGPEGKYIIYGLYNGLIIGSSEILRETYDGWKKKLHIKGSEHWYILFTILRTSFLTLMSMFFDRCLSTRQGFAMLADAFIHFDPAMILTIPAGRGGTASTPYVLGIIAGGCLLVFIVGLMKERGKDVRQRIAALPLPVSCGLYFLLLLSTGLFGCTLAAKGFIYAQF